MSQYFFHHLSRLANQKRFWRKPKCSSYCEIITEIEKLKNTEMEKNTSKKSKTCDIRQSVLSREFRYCRVSDSRGKVLIGAYVLMMYQ